jgi:O-antigen/teichoic acid export membrane protein
LIASKAVCVAAGPVLSKLPALTLRVSFSWTLAGMLTYAACQWGMLVAIARLGSPRMVGQFALGLAISSPVILLANLELRAIISTDALREYRFQDYLGLRLLTTLLALAVIAGLAVALGESAEIARVVVALGVFKAMEAVSDLQYGLFQQRGRNDRMSRSLMLRGPISLAAVAGGLALTGSLFWGVAAMAAGGALVLLLHDLPGALLLLRPVSGTEAEPARPRWDWRVLKRLALLSAPLGMVTMLFSLNASIPSLLIQKKFGVASVGVFAVLLSLMAAGHVGVNALGHSTTIRLASQYSSGDARGFRRLLIRMLGVAGFLGVCGMLVATFLGKPILFHLFGPAYADEVGVLRWLMGAGAASYLASTLSYAMIATRQLKIQPVIMLVSVAVTLCLGLILIPQLGLTGVAVALLGSSLFQFGANLAVTLRALRRIGSSARAGRPS